MPDQPTQAHSKLTLIAAPVTSRYLLSDGHLVEVTSHIPGTSTERDAVLKHADKVWPGDKGREISGGPATVHDGTEAQGNLLDQPTDPGQLPDTDSDGQLEIAAGYYP